MQARCEICRELKPFDQIDVYKLDLSKKHKLPEGTFKRNINFCIDNQSCVDGAIKKGKELCKPSE